MSLFRFFIVVAAAVCLSLGTSLATAQDVVREPERETPVLFEADVVVIGGGLSGVGAALGAARNGAKTVVVERTGYLGGWMRGTGMGNVMAIKDWRPSLEEGVLLDITKRMIELKAEGYSDLKTVLDTGHLLVTNPEMLPQAFQSLVLESGAKIQYFTTYVDSIVKDGKIEAVIVETPVGRGAIRGKIFIDCTGLATVAAASGAPTRKSEAFMGLASWIGGVDVQKYQEWAKTRPEEGSPELRKWLEEKLGHPITSFSSTETGPDMMNYPWDDWWSRNSGIYGEAFREAVEKGELPLFYRVGDDGMISVIEGLKVIEFGVAGGISRLRTYIVRVDPTNIEEVSDAHAKSAQLLFEYAAFLNKHVPGFEKAEVLHLADMTINRAGRSIENDEFDDESEDINPPVGKPVEHDDAIAILQRGKDNAVYEVPYSAMLPEKIDNLLAVGKSSAGGIKFRTHMLSMIMGQAAGTAAAIAVQDGVSPKDVNIRKVQAELREDGVPIPAKP